MNSSDNHISSGCRTHLMPLMSSSFTPGQAQATVNSFQDKGQRQIAQAELYYFSARAEECKDIAELYLGRTKIFIFACPQDFYILSQISLWEIRLLPKWVSEIFRNVCTRQNRTHHQMKHGFLRFRQLSGYGAYAPSHRQTASA